MAKSTENNERLTTIVCALVAIAILAAGVTARQSDSAPSDEPAQWESDVRYQIKTAFRHDARQRDARLAQVESVMAAWKASPQTDQDRELLIEWLSETVVRSMPGSVEDLSPQPEFNKSNPAKVAKVQQAALPKQLTLSTIQAPALLAGGGIPDIEVTPTPYDPFEEDGEQNVPAASEKMVKLAQPITVIPAQQRVVNKPLIEMAALTQAPLPDSLRPDPELAESTPPLELSPPVTAPPAEEPVAVNLTELAARIAGYHDGLDEVETDLLRANKPSLALVTEQANRLDTMTRDYRFVKLYYDSLTEDEQQGILVPRPLSATLQEVGRQLDRYEASLDADYLGSIDGAQAEQIAELRELLSTIGARVSE